MKNTAFHVRRRLATSSTLLLEANPNGGTPYDEAVLKLDQHRNLHLTVETRVGGDGTHIEEWHGLTRTWLIARGPAEVDVASVRAELAHGGCLHDLMARVAEGLDSAWDGRNTVGTLTVDADKAEDELLRHFDENDYSTGRAVWEAEEWFQGEYGEVSPDMDDDALKALAEEFEAWARRDGVILVNTMKVLELRRDALRDDREDSLDED